MSAAAATLQPRKFTAGSTWRGITNRRGRGREAAKAAQAVAGSSFTKTVFAYMRLATRRMPRKINTAPAKESAPGISAKKIAPHVAAKTT